VSFLGATALFLVGIAAGIINTVVGSASLISYPTLLALGYEPVVANMTNSVGLVPGSVSGAIGYRRELRGMGPLLRVLMPASAAGGLAGALLLLVLPSSVFESVIPALILLACALVVAQPRLHATLRRRRRDGDDGIGAGFIVTVLLCALYGGYFGAAQGVILIALLAIFRSEGLQPLNATKNVLVGIVNGIAAVLFVAVGDVAWAPALVLAAGAAAGGQAGARVGRRLPPNVLRVAIVAVGLVVAVRMIVS